MVVYLKLKELFNYHLFRNSNFHRKNLILLFEERCTTSNVSFFLSFINSTLADSYEYSCALTNLSKLDVF